VTAARFAAVTEDRIVSLTHAVVWTDHHNARVLRFDAQQASATKVRAGSHYTRQHHSQVRSEHEFFAEVCAALEGISEVVIAGARTSVADFRHYAEKHRPHVAAHIVAYEVVDHPTDAELLALAKDRLLKHDRMKGVTNPF
jgi:hypothetical protein